MLPLNFYALKFKLWFLKTDQVLGQQALSWWKFPQSAPLLWAGCLSAMACYNIHLFYFSVLVLEKRTSGIQGNPLGTSRISSDTFEDRVDSSNWAGPPAHFKFLGCFLLNEIPSISPLKMGISLLRSEVVQFLVEFFWICPLLLPVEHNALYPYQDTSVLDSWYITHQKQVNGH